VLVPARCQRGITTTPASAAGGLARGHAHGTRPALRAGLAPARAWPGSARVNGHAPCLRPAATADDLGGAVAKLLIGTSGWVYKHWLEVFYPPRFPGERMLPFYAEHFSTVEVNFSFYKLPERAVFEKWRDQAPPGFCFAVKGSRYLTHMKKLKDPEEPLARLMQHAGGLGEKLGPVLFQFPSKWRINLERLDAFLVALRSYAPQRFAFEFRHRTWLVPEVFERLERAGAALCLPVGWGLPREEVLTAPWTYIRMHGGRESVGFGDDELAEWAGKIRAFMAAGADAYVYFNNDPAGHAVRDARRLAELLA
jgi:uncharacterized protein YecE (DUF72 family)